MGLRRGWIWYLAGLLLAVIAGLIAMLALRRAVPTAEPVRQATRPVIVARTDIPARQVVPADAVETRNLPLEDIPSGAIFRVEDAVGKYTLIEFKAGSPLLAQNLVAPLSGPGSSITSTVKLAALLPNDKVGVVLAAGDLMSQSGDVDIGDRVDILASMVVVGDQEGEAGQVSLMSLQNVSVIKVLQEVQSSGSSGQSGQAPPRTKITGLVLAVDPQDAVILKYFIDANAKVSIDVRPPKLTSIFVVLPVSINYIADKYGIQVPKPLTK
jgi:Flp pilus assembly protein CpaB